MLEMSVFDYPYDMPYSQQHVKFWENRFFIDEKMKVCQEEHDYFNVLNCPDYDFNQSTDMQTTIHGVLYGMTVMKLRVPTFRMKDTTYLKELKFNLKPFTKIIPNTPDGDLFKFNLGFSIPTFSPATDGFEHQEEMYALILIYLKQLADYYSFYENHDCQVLQLEEKDTDNKSVINERQHMGLIQNAMKATIYGNQEQQIAD